MQADIFYRLIKKLPINVRRLSKSKWNKHEINIMFFEAARLDSHHAIINEIKKDRKFISFYRGAFTKKRLGYVQPSISKYSENLRYILDNQHILNVVMTI